MPSDFLTTDLGDGLVDHARTEPIDRAWVASAIRKLQADTNRSADTHLHLARTGGSVPIYLKDESTHPTGSLKHRLARSLVLYALCNGRIGPDTTLVEASSGSTAVSEAYFARMLGLPFVAVMADTTSPSKIALIEREGGRCHLVEDPTSVYAVAQQLADESGGHYLDQFTHAERATDWRGNNNIAESILDQLALEPHLDPAWLVVGAGTGGTSATLGRFVRYRGLAARVCVADPEGSAFLPAWLGEDTSGCRPSRIEGIGRPRPEPSFVPGVVDRMMRVPDAASVAAMHLLHERTGLHGGPSSGTNLVAALRIAADMQAADESGCIVTLVCDKGERYAGQPFLHEPRPDVAEWRERLEAVWDTGRWA